MSMPSSAHVNASKALPPGHFLFTSGELLPCSFAEGQLLIFMLRPAESVGTSQALLTRSERKLMLVYDAWQALDIPVS